MLLSILIFIWGEIHHNIWDISDLRYNVYNSGKVIDLSNQTKYTTCLTSEIEFAKCILVLMLRVPADKIFVFRHYMW